MSGPLKRFPEGDQARRRILRAIQEYRDVHDYAPTIRELQELTASSSTSVVAHHLGVLEETGHIARTPGIARSIRVVTR